MPARPCCRAATFALLLALLCAVCPVAADHKDEEQQFPQELLQRGSLITCSGNSTDSRTCTAQRLCLHAASGSLVLLAGPETVQDGLPDARFDPALISLSSVANHNVQWANIVDLPASSLNVSSSSASFQPRIAWVPGVTLLFKRFKPNNIFHVLHDDLLPLFATLLLKFQHWKEDKSNIRLFAMEGWAQGDFGELYDTLSHHPTLYLRDFAEETDFVCFEEAHLGLSKATTWYDYGFFGPQGPIPDKQVDGRLVRRFAETMRRLLLSGKSNGHHGRDDDGSEESPSSVDETLKDAVDDGDGSTTGSCNDRDSRRLDAKLDSGIDENCKKSNSDLPRMSGRKSRSNFRVDETKSIVLFSRRRNRLILNEQQLVERLSDAFECPVRVVSMETHTFAEQIAELGRAWLAVGLHGSILGMAMFLPANATLLELFPYAVPPENYTPYKTMCQLNGMQLRYLHWVNTDPQRSHGHPERTPDLGGISHLPVEEQNEILQSKTVPPHKCCSNPYWLYRIYQDTEVDFENIIELVRLHLASQLPPPAERSLYPAQVTDVACRIVQRTDAQDSAVIVTWAVPWNGAAVGVRTYEAFHQETLKKFDISATSLELHVADLDRTETHTFWIRAVGPNGARGPFSRGATCA